MRVEQLEDRRLLSVAAWDPGAGDAHDQVGGFQAPSGEVAAGFALPDDLTLVTSFALEPYGLSYERYQQTFGGADVLGGQLSVYRDPTGTIAAVIGAYYPDISAANAVGLSRGQAQAVAAADVPGADNRLVDLMIDPTSRHYFYQVDSQGTASRWIHWVEAGSGAILNKIDTMETLDPGFGIGVKGDVKDLTGLTTLDLSISNDYLMAAVDEGGHDRQLVYDYGGSFIIGYLMTDGDNIWDNASLTSPGQSAGVDAQYYAALTDNYYHDVFGRQSFDNNYAAMISRVHYSDPFIGTNNAGWNGTGVIYGDGDSVNYTNFSGGLDVVAHEWTHAVTEYTSNLVYQNEAGALNEAFSDIMGATIEFYADQHGLVDPAFEQADWLLGEDVVLGGGYFRNMADPETVSWVHGTFPDHYSERYTGTDDNGGVHVNSSIVNHAFQLLVDGGENASLVNPDRHTTGEEVDITVTGIGLDDAASVFYTGFIGLSSNATMADARSATEAAAAALFEAGSQQAQSVTAAWVAVGVGPVPSDTSPPTVTVGLPNGGETWDVGSQHNVTWNADDNVGVTSVDLYYSTDGGGSFQEFATGEANARPPPEPRPPSPWRRSPWTIWQRI